MHPRTKAKVVGLRLFLKRHAKRLCSLDPQNIVGLQVQRKVVGKSRKRYYSIVFHVKEKQDSLTSRRRIPSHVKIKIGNQRIRVPTDVIETSASELCGGVGGRVSMGGSNEFGTVGLIASRSDGTWYLVSNMHVLGHLYLLNNQTDVSIPTRDQIPNILDENNEAIASFERGLFNKFIDAGIARVLDKGSVKREIPGFGKPSYTQPLNMDDVHSDGYPVKIFGCVAGLAEARIVDDDVSKVFPSAIGDIMMFELVQISPSVSSRGDSGALVFEASNNGVGGIGIIVGKDKSYCYAIPLDKILSTFQIDIGYDQ